MWGDSGCVGVCVCIGLGVFEGGSRNGCVGDSGYVCVCV